MTLWPSNLIGSYSKDCYMHTVPTKSKVGLKVTVCSWSYFKVSCSLVPTIDAPQCTCPTTRFQKHFTPSPQLAPSPTANANLAPRPGNTEKQQQKNAEELKFFCDGLCMQ